MNASTLTRAIALLAAVSTIPSSMAQKLTKPIINPQFPSLNQGLWDNLKPTMNSQVTNWGWGWMPNRCYLEAVAYNWNPYDVEVFNVKYPDCNDAWIMCRHNNSPVTKIDMVDIFGRIPVQARQAVRHLMSFPANGGTWAHAYTGWCDVTIFAGEKESPGGKSPTLFAHEIGHCVDAFRDTAAGSKPFSSSSAWINAYNRDQAVSDSYAQSNQVENFAQEFVIALFDKVVPGGVGTVQPGWNQIYQQYSSVQQYMGAAVVPGGTCGPRIPHDYNVCMGPAAGCGTAGGNGNARIASPVSTMKGETLKLASVRSDNVTSCRH